MGTRGVSVTRSVLREPMMVMIFCAMVEEGSRIVLALDFTVKRLLLFSGPKEIQ